MTRLRSSEPPPTPALRRLLGGDVARVLGGRALRGFADGFVSVLLARHLDGIGFSPLQVGAIVTGTLIGSAALTIWFGLAARRVPLRTLLLLACVLMAATGLGFATVTWFWPLFAIAVIGTLNPSAGDVSAFLPTEQAYLADRCPAPFRPAVYARYNVAGTLAGALGALASGLPDAVARWQGWSPTSTQRAAFLVYTAAATVIFGLYRRLPRPDSTDATVVDDVVRSDGAVGGITADAGVAGVPIVSTDAVVAADGASTSPGRGFVRTPRRMIVELAALFSLDSAGSGFVVTSLLVLWLHLRFGLSAGTTATVFFATGLLGGCSQFLAPRLAQRIGLIRTMAFTHLPASALLAAAAFAPSGPVAIGLLLLRALFAQMDVPARQAFVMAVVPPDQRAAASSFTNVPRSLASALTPIAAGALLTRSTFGWPLLIAGSIKVTYDLLLLAFYRNVSPDHAESARLR